MTRREMESPQHATTSIPSLAPPGEVIRLLVSLMGEAEAGAMFEDTRHSAVYTFFSPSNTTCKIPRTQATRPTLQQHLCCPGPSPFFSQHLRPAGG